MSASNTAVQPHNSLVVWGRNKRKEKEKVGRQREGAKERTRNKKEKEEENALWVFSFLEPAQVPITLLAVTVSLIGHEPIKYLYSYTICYFQNYKNLLIFTTEGLLSTILQNGPD